MSVSQDATSGLYVPASSSEWTTLLAGTGISNPSHLWLCQDAASPVVDSIGSSTFITNAGTPTFNSTVTGWSRKGIFLADGTAASLKALGPNIGASAMMFAYVSFPATANSSRRTTLQLGGAFASMVALEIAESSSPLHVQVSVKGGAGQGGASAIGTGDAHSVVLPCLLVGNVTTGQTYLLTGQDTLNQAATSGGIVVDSVLQLGGDNADSWLSGANAVLYVSAWFGASAELTPTAMATLMGLLKNGPSATGSSIASSGTSSGALSGAATVTGSIAASASASAALAGAALVTGAITAAGTSSAAFSSTVSRTATLMASGISSGAFTSSFIVTHSGAMAAAGTSAGAFSSNVIVVPFENGHHPWPGQARGVFEYGDSQIVWTGDRLLVARDGDYFNGGSSFWYRNVATTSPVLNWGIPAFLPLQTDSTPGITAGGTGTYIDTCLTPTLRVVGHTGSDGSVNLDVFDRATGAALNTTSFAGTATNLRVLKSGTQLVALWMSASALLMSVWMGDGWTNASVTLTSINTYDVAISADGFHLAWLVGTQIYLGKFVGASAASTPYAWGTQLSLLGSYPILTAGSAIAINVAPDSSIGVVAGNDTDGVFATGFPPDLGALWSGNWWFVDSSIDVLGGLAVCSRGLRNVNAEYEWLIHYAQTNTSALIASYYPIAGVTGLFTTKANTDFISKSFRVGDEVFIWARDINVGTGYLLGGHYKAQTCGFADREVTLEASNDSVVGWPHMVTADPLDTTGTKFTWARLFDTGQSYVHGGNALVGDMDFLPSLSTATYGRGVYLSGSAVRCWDGTTLGDAGFQTYPVISLAQTTGGSMTVSPTLPYFFLARYVRYSKQNERFESATKVSVAINLTGSNSAVNVTIHTLPCTNHDDIQIEVYRTVAGGTTFYLDGVIANDPTTPTIIYKSTRKDVSTPVAPTDLIEQEGDPHETGLGNQQELESFGPVGCAILAVGGDRLWGAGGQVPPGQVQFSKLHDDGFAAGFDDLAGYEEVDTEGGAITSLARNGDTMVAFEANKLFAIAGTGPDNFGAGGFDVPEIVLADGASTHLGTILTQAGVAFWGDDGPRLLSGSYQVTNLSIPIQKLSSTMTPTGVRVDLTRQEVVWYTADGDALLWNYYGGNSRFARWDKLFVAGACPSAIVTTDGRLQYPDDDAAGDGGRDFTFTVRTGLMMADSVIAGGTYVRSVGLAGAFQGPHSVRARVYFNSSPLWSEQWTWEPADNTWLSLGTDVENDTPAQVDALGSVDHSGVYMTHKRTQRNQCAHFQVEISNAGAAGPTFIPTEITLEMGAMPGLARVPPSTFGA